MGAIFFGTKFCLEIRNITLKNEQNYTEVTKLYTKIIPLIKGIQMLEKRNTTSRLNWVKGVGNVWRKQKSNSWEKILSSYPVHAQFSLFFFNTIHFLINYKNKPDHSYTLSIHNKSSSLVNSSTVLWPAFSGKGIWGKYINLKNLGICKYLPTYKKKGGGGRQIDNPEYLHYFIGPYFAWEKYPFEPSRLHMNKNVCYVPASQGE